MLQKINFMTTLPKPSRYYISEHMLIKIVLAFLVLLGILTGIQALTLFSSDRKLHVIEKQIVTAQTNFDAVKKQMMQYDVNNLTKELSEKRALLQSLQSRKVTSGQCAYLSNYLTALAETPVNGLWLTKINVDLNKDQIELNGTAYYPSLLLKLVKDLNKSVCFKDRQFGPVELLQEKQKQKQKQNSLLDFSIHSTKELSLGAL